MKPLLLIALLALTGCSGSQTTFTSLKPKDGVSMGVDVSQSAASCEAGGVTIKTYVDSNSNSQLEAGELVKQVATVCNGLNGQDGDNVTVAVASNNMCPNGGITINGIPVCNGEDGQMGPQGHTGVNGAQGPQGIPGTPGAQGAQGLQGQVGPVGPQGPAGANGSISNLTMVQLCPGDTASFKEYGFIVGTELFAVYFDKSQPIAFLAKLNPGNYATTNGSNCQFTYSNSGTLIKLSNNSGTTTVSVH